MDWIERSNQKYADLFGYKQPAAYATDHDFQDILSRFIFGEVFFQGSQADRQRELITLVVLTTNQTLPQLRAHTGAALNVGLTPVEIKEAIYQCDPYICRLSDLAIFTAGVGWISKPANYCRCVFSAC